MHRPSIILYMYRYLFGDWGPFLTLFNLFQKFSLKNLTFATIFHFLLSIFYLVKSFLFALEFRGKIISVENPGFEKQNKESFFNSNEQKRLN